MNFLFVFPPLCLPVNPYISVPLLSTILRNSGYFVDSLDLNLEFYKECIFEKTSLVSSYERLKKIYKSISNNTFSFANKNEEYYIKKNFTNISRLINTEYNKIENTINNIKRAVDTLKSQTDFYDIDKNYESIRIVNDALNIYLSSFFVNDKLNKKIGLKYKTLKYFVENSKLNPFYDYFLNKIKNGYFDKYDCIFISQPYDIQQFATYTLAYLLKKHTKIKVCLGGNIPNRLSETFAHKIEIFDNHFDYILLGLGEETIIPFAKYLSSEISANEVPGLIYVKDKKILKNKPIEYLNDINKRPLISLNGYYLNNYLTPEIIIPIQVSKGCPWGKCSFCVFHAGKTKFQITPVSIVINEIKHFYETYGITKFEFVDEALPPQYYFEFAKEIIKTGLKIHYYGFARLDSGFTNEILKTMYDSGFRVFEWGYETYCKRIMDIFNKGIDCNKREEILKRSNNAKIWNHCLTIVSIPFETIEEEKENINYYLHNTKLIHSRLLAPFDLFKGTKLAKEQENLNMTNIKDEGDLSIRLCYERKDKLEYSNDMELVNLQKKLSQEYEPTMWNTLLYSVDEYIFLYVVKYGKDKCLNIKRKKKVK